MFCANAVLVYIPAVMLYLSVVNYGDGYSLESCQQIDSCTCLFDNGDKIDLHFASNSEDGKPIFYYKFLQTVFKYSPCMGFPCGAETKDSTLCIDDSFRLPSKDLGTMSSARFGVTGKNISLIYASNDTGKAVTSRVRLQCSEVEDFVLEANTTTVYNFTLATRCACPEGCGPTVSDEGLSPGTILLFIFFSILILYFGLGCAYRRTMYGGSCAEVVPHGDFWFSLPSLIKDGYMFFISPCLGNRTEYRTYDKL